MPRPTSSTTIQRPDLGAIAFEYMLEASQRGFIGAQVLPIKQVPRQSADYPKIPIEALLKMPAKIKRAPRAAYARSDWEFETGTYTCEEYGWEEPVDDVERALYSRFFDAEVVAAQRAVDVILRNQEKRVADAVFNIANITATADVTIPWNTAATAVPYDDVQTAIAAMRLASGLLPNTLVLSWVAFKAVLATSELRSRLQYTSPIELMPREAQLRILAQYFDVGQVLIGNAIYDSGKKGQSYSIADIWDDEYAGLFAVSAGGEDMKEPCLGRTFLWTEDSPTNLVTESYREEQTRSDIYRVRQNVDEAFIFTGAGYLLGNIIHP